MANFESSESLCMLLLTTVTFKLAILERLTQRELKTCRLVKHVPSDISLIHLKKSATCEERR